MTRVEFPASVYPRKAANSQSTEVDNPRVSQIINVGGNPTTVGQLREVICGFVVSSNEYCQVRRYTLSGIILIERLHLLVLLWNGHAFQVGVVSDGLKVSTAEKDVNFDSILLFRELEKGRRS